MIYEIEGDRIYAGTGGMDYRPEQKTIVFVHGAGMDHTIWVLFNRFFARSDYNAIAVDLPGHGLSAGKPLSTIEQMADWLGVFLDKAGISKTALIGHSMGSLIAIEAASRLPEKVKHIILLGTACPMQVGEPLLSAARQNKHSAVDMIMLYGHAYCSQLGGNPVAGVNIVNSSKRLLERSLDGRLYAGLNACNQYANGLQAAENIHIPATLILGDQDRMTPPGAASSLIDALKHAQVEILTQCGHMMLSEQPEEVHRALVAALSSRSSTSTH